MHGTKKNDGLNEITVKIGNCFFLFIYGCTENRMFLWWMCVSYKFKWARKIFTDVSAANETTTNFCYGINPFKILFHIFFYIFLFVCTAHVFVCVGWLLSNLNLEGELHTYTNTFIVVVTVALAFSWMIFFFRKFN